MKNEHVADPHHIAVPSIVVAGYNRPHSLRRLLHSLAQARIPAGTRLHISLDHSLVEEVRQVAVQFSWPHGEKIVEVHPKALGLRQHLLYCGGLAERYGAAIILEDDLIVSPAFYEFTLQALDFQRGEAQIAGISLYHYLQPEHSPEAFFPWPDTVDNYYVQWPSSWGQAWTARQWQDFREWLDQQDDEGDAYLPAYVKTWERNSWKRSFVAYLIAVNRFFLYPRQSLATHFGDAGAHQVLSGSDQSPLDFPTRNWNFRPLAESRAVYDAWFEMLPDRLGQLNPKLKEYPLTVDLYGAKEAHEVPTKWMVTAREMKEGVSWEKSALPREINVAMELPGEGIWWGTKEQVKAWSKVPQQVTLAGPAPTLDIILVVDKWDHAAAQTFLSLESGLAETASITVLGECPPEFHPARHYPLVPAEGIFTQLHRLLMESNADLALWMHPGYFLAPDWFAVVQDLSLRFPTIDWFCFRRKDGPRDLASYRWTRDRYGRAKDAEILQLLGPAASVWRRPFWRQDAAPISDATGLLARAFRSTLPIPVDFALYSGQTEPFPLGSPRERLALRAQRTLPGRLLSRYFRKQFVEDSHYRWVHLELEQYPGVIRRNAESGAWEMRRY